MKVTVRKDRNLIIVNARNTQNENDVETIEITVPEEYEDFNKKIAFITDDGVVWDFIENNKYTLTNAITKYKKVKFYIWLTQDNKDFRSEERTIVFNKNQDANEEVTEEEISGFNRMINILEEEITEVTGLQEDLTNLINTVQTKLDNGDFIGPQGPQGEPGESYDDTEIKEEISDIKEEQTTQNTRIEELEEQVSELESNQLTGTATGQSIYIEDSTNTKVRSIGLSGNSEQESTNGYQLLNVEDGTYSNNGITAVGKDGEIVLNGTATATAVIGFPFAYTFNTSTNYTISANNPQTEVNQYDVMLRFDNNVKPFNLNTINKVSTISFTEETTVANLTIRIASGVTLTNFKLKPMIEIGSTAHPWEPYTGGQASPNPSYPQEIHSTGDSGNVNEKVQNKNLFDKDNVTPNSWLNINGNTETQNSYVVSDFIPVVEGNQYYIPKRGTTRTKYYLADKSPYSNTWDVADYAQVITIPSNVKYIRFTIAISGSATVDINTFQFEQGSTASDYVAHEEQNISFPLAQGQKLMQGDYLADDGVHHVRGEIVLDGVTDGLKFTTAEPNRNNRFILNLSDIKQRTYTENSYMKSSHFSYNTTVYFDSQDQVGFCANNLGLFVRFGSNSETNTITKANNWLAEHLPKFQYQLAEEVIEAYTEEQQAVWEQIKALRTYKPVTHISSTDEVPATVDVTYVKDLETVINNLGGA